VRDIPESEWREFLTQFSGGHRAWLATVDRAAVAARGQVTAIERPLGSVLPDISDGRIVGIEIRFQADPQARDSIRINAPVRLRVDETPEGVARGLEIQDESGGCTRIRFRAAPLPEALDGIAPGELPAGGG
jgi:hypothetical protein